MNRLPAPAAPACTAVRHPSRLASRPQATRLAWPRFAAKRAVSRASEAVSFCGFLDGFFGFSRPPTPLLDFFTPTPPTPHTTATYLPIAGPSGAVKTGPTYLLHRVQRVPTDPLSG